MIHPALGVIAPLLYFDYLSTTPIDPRVAARLHHAMTTVIGNASSANHAFGDAAARAVDEARHHVAALANGAPHEVIFTSGATESLNLAIRGAVEALGRKHGRLRVVVSPLEHVTVLETCERLARSGAISTTWLRVTSQGRLDLDHLEETCANGPALLCAMAANNEIGSVYPLEEIGAIAVRHGVPWICDATQAIGKVPLDFECTAMAYMALSAHKIYGPMGVGALLVRRGSPMVPQITGGGQQRGLRAGTLNIHGIVGLGEACRLRETEREVDEARIAALRDRLEASLGRAIPDLVINGDPDSRLAGCLSIAIPGILNQAVIARVRSHLAISTGSACASGVEAPSHVLRAMGLALDIQESTLRLSLGKFTTAGEVDRAAEILCGAVRAVRRSVAREGSR